MPMRDAIIDALTARLRDLPSVRALWLGGSDATGRRDAYSDIDYCVIADDGSAGEVFAAAESALAAISPIEIGYRLPQCPWPHMEQAFYRLRDAGPHLLVDFCVLSANAPPEARFMERERHGQPQILFDPSGLLAPVPMDRAAHQVRIAARIADLRQRFPLFQTLVERNLARGQAVDALHFYMNLTLRPLIDLLRIAYCPDRFDFGARYLKFDLPPQIAAEVERLSYVPDTEGLRQRLSDAARLFESTLAQIDASGTGVRVATRPAPAS